MDYEALKVLIGAFGGAGVAYFALWTLFKSYRSTIDTRFTTLEKAVEECNEDRRKMHAEIGQIYSQVAEKMASSLAANTIALDRMAKSFRCSKMVDDEAR